MVGGVAQAMAELAGLFGWAADEEVLESFACALLQTYGCQHNAFTPPREAGPQPSAVRLSSEYTDVGGSLLGFLPYKLQV